MKTRIASFYKKFNIWILLFLFAGFIPTISLLEIENPSNKVVKKIEIEDLSSGNSSKLSLDELLYGALAAEMPISFEVEALKAQVVAIHTYFLKNNSEYLKDGKISLNNANGSVIKHFAFWSKEKRKEKWGKDFLKNELKLRLIVSQVKNQILFFENDLALTLFFSWCYKSTNPCDAVFSQNLPYLKSVDSPEYESNLFPNLKKTKLEIKKTDMENILKSKFNSEEFSNKLNQMNPKEWIKIIEFTNSGCAKKIDILGEKISGNNFRHLLNLKSPYFNIFYNSTNETFETECIGYGHGVGMSQYGANYYAKQKMNYKQILQHYYTGTILKSSIIH